MPQKTYMYETQWNQLLNAIGTGDSSAVVSALSNIKTSLDDIYTRLNTVGFNATQWTNLVDAITSGGEGGTIDIDTTQWTNLLSEISKGDMSATATALNNIYTRLNTVGFNATQWTNLLSEISKGDMSATAAALNNIYTRLNTVGFNATQWNTLTNAISNQSITVDLSNINSDNVLNLSNVTGGNITNAFNNLNSTLTNFNTFKLLLITTGSFSANTPRTFTLSETYKNYLMLSIEVMQYGNPMDSMIIPVSYFESTSSTRRPILYVSAISTQVEIYKNDDNSVIVKLNKALSDAFHISIYGGLRNA